MRTVLIVGFFTAEVAFDEVVPCLINEIVRMGEVGRFVIGEIGSCDEDLVPER